MSDVKKLTITIDGKECTCEKGEYLYDVAARNGINGKVQNLKATAVSE